MIPEIAFDKGHIGPGSTNKEDFALKVAEHRQQHYALLYSRVLEAMTQVVEYLNLPASISAIHLETELRRSRHGVIIGLLRNGTSAIIGRPTSVNYNLYKYPIVRGIRYDLPEELLLPKEQYKQITPQDLTGNYVLIRNRFDETYYTEAQIADFYCHQLAEIKASRYSLTLQAKAITYFKGTSIEQNNRLNKQISDFYNGTPIIKVENALDIDSTIGTISGASVIPHLLQSLKDEYNNTYGEMLNQLGILNLGVMKESGVNAFESSSNLGYLDLVANVYIKARQDAFNLWNYVMYGANTERHIRVQYRFDMNDYTSTDQRPAPMGPEWGNPMVY